MQPVLLPDCRARAPIEALDARQRAELVRLLAEKGPGALEEWLRKESLRDPLVRERIERHRARLERSAQAERERQEGDLARRRGETLSAWEAKAAEGARREEELRQRIARAMGAPVLHLDGLGAVVESGDGAAGGAKRARVSWLARIWARILLAWAKMLAWKPGRKPTAPVRVGDDEIDAWQVARERPELLARARRWARRQGFWAWLRSWWRRLWGREDAVEDLRRMLLAEAEQARRRLVLLAETERQAAERELDELRRQGPMTEAERRKALEELEAAQRRAEQEWARRTADEPYRTLAQEVLGELADAGLVDAQGQATERLLQRFSALLLDDTVRGAAEGGPAVPGTYRGGEGEYERGQLASLQEVGAMELVDTVVRARTRHPAVRHIQDDDIIVHRELRSTRAHVVVVFDHSNSMEEAERLPAAKKVSLVLHRALREDDPDHRIDLVAMGTSVKRVDLAHCWAAKASGFTNQGAALRLARRILESSDADRRLVYMITDGLPEARTLPDGRDVADRVDACMPDAEAAAKQLRELGGVRLLILQLETKDPKYLKAAQRVAKAGGGRVVGLDPKELARTLLVDLREATRVPALAG